MMRFKKYIALLLCISFVLGFGTVVNAEDVTDEDFLTEEIAEEEYEYIPLVTEEDITEEEFLAEIEREREIIKIVPPIGNEDEVSIASVTEDITSAQWERLFESAFGYEYYENYMHPVDGAEVSGNTNALEINSTDLHLPGKNGLDLKLTRRHNNHGIGKSYTLIEDYGSGNVNQKRDFYKLNYGENEHIFVACYAEDDFYEYLRQGCYIESFPEEEERSITINDESINYYLVEDICDVLTEVSENAIHLTYNFEDGISHNDVNIKPNKIQEDEIYRFEAFSERVKLGGDWHFMMPTIRFELTDTGSENDNSEKKSWYDYEGIFRDINDNVYSFRAGAKVEEKKKNGEFKLRKYSFSATPNGNNSLLFKSYYNPQVHDSGFEYTFYVNDVLDGYTYYFNHENKTNFSKMMFVGIEDEFGNIITYQYNSDNKISKITDTYGMDVNFIYGENSLTVSYDNGAKNFSYLLEENVGEINNGSVLEGKPVNKFTYTNEANEQTIYYYRDTQLPVAEYWSSSWEDINNNYYITPKTYTKLNHNSNIERIVYSNGLTVDYSYSRVYQLNRTVDVVIGEWAVSKIEKTIGNKKSAETFSFEGDEAVTVECVGAGGLFTKRTYDSEDKLTSIVSMEDETSNEDYCKETLTYDENQLVERVVYSNGKEDTYAYTYKSGYRNLVRRVTLNGYTTDYTYFYREEPAHIGTRRTYLNIPETTITAYEVNSKNKEHYTITSTLAENGRKIASEEMTKGDEVYGKTYYTYDNEGNVTSVNKIIGDTNSDGAVDESDESSKTNYIHSYEDGIRAVTLTKNDVEDFEGKNVGAITEVYKYDMYGNPVSYTDGNGNIITITYDNASRPVKYEFPEYMERTVQYNIPQREVITTDERGARYKYTYDELGNILKVQREFNGWQTLEAYSYDEAGRLVRKNTYRQYGEGTKEVYSYDVFNRPVEKKVYELPDELLYTEAFVYTESSSGFTVSADKTGSDGSAIATVKQTYDEKGNLKKTEYITNDKTVVTAKTYDFLNRVLSETDAKGNTVTYEYSVPGNITKITYPDGTTTQTGYDMLGRTVSTTDAMGNTSHFQYDSLNRLIRKITPFDGEITGETLYEYEANGNVAGEYVKINEGEYRHTTYQYNAVNQLTSTTQHGSDGDIATRYNYDVEGNLTAFETGLSEYTDSMEHPTHYSYDKWGNVTSLTDPMGYTESYTYDYLGNMLSKTDKNGNTVTFEYNAFGLANKTDGETQIVNTYNGIGQLVSANTVGQNQTSYTYDPFGNVATVTQGNSLQSYTYDNNGNVTAYSISIDGEQKASETYTYNNMNRLTAQNVNGKNYSFTYNGNGNMTGRAVDGVASETYTYNNAGLLVAKTGANGTYVNLYRPDGFKTKEIKGTFEKAFVYDDFGRLTTDSYVNGEEVLYTNTYTYDSRGNRLTMSDGTVTTNYTYDLNNRMTARNKTENGTETERISLFYDFNGNTVSQRTLTRGTTAEMSVGVLGEGNDTGIKLFEYDGFNRLTKYTDDDSVATYSYYADNLRAGKTVNGASKQFYWNGSNLAGETSGTGVKTYSYDLLGVSAVNDGTATTYFDKDTHNDIVAHLNGEGAITSSQYFDSFGNKNTTITEDEFGYTGEYVDAESGLIYLRNRYYDPETGRFLTEDTHWNPKNMICGDKECKVGEIKIPDMSAIMQSGNLYAYCSNNPIHYVDPFGESQTVDLGSGWSYRIDNGQNGQQHIHVDGPNGQRFSRNADGTSHDGSKDKPPKWVRKKIDEKLGKRGPWPWDNNDSNDDMGDSNNNSKNDSANKSSSENNSYKSSVTNTVSNGVGIGVVVYSTYIIFKWVAAAVTAPYTAGGSLVIAGATP